MTSRNRRFIFTAAKYKHFFRTHLLNRSNSCVLNSYETQYQHIIDLNGHSLFYVFRLCVTDITWSDLLWCHLIALPLFFSLSLPIWLCHLAHSPSVCFCVFTLLCISLLSLLVVTVQQQTWHTLYMLASLYTIYLYKYSVHACVNSHWDCAPVEAECSYLNCTCRVNITFQVWGSIKMHPAKSCRNIVTNAART